MKMMWLIAFTPIAGPPSGPLFEAGWLLPHPHISNSIGSSNARFSIVGHVRLAVAAQAGAHPPTAPFEMQFAFREFDTSEIQLFRRH